MAGRLRAHKEAALPQSPAQAVAQLDDRRLNLVRAAYGIIASDGFESLRTRDVAEKVGINVATLHYYFPSKESLIGAVALYLAAQFETVHAPGSSPRRKVRSTNSGASSPTAGFT